MNAWERQQALARTTAVWGAGSVAAGAVLAVRAGPRRRAFSQQQIGWGLVDLGLVLALNVVQGRRMRRLPDPKAPAVLEREQRRLRTLLWVNVVADAGYVLGGIAMWRRPRAQVAGAGAGIVVQGAFLLVHDVYHVLGIRS